MKYYVVMPDGQKFGPADVATLNIWVQEGRVTRESTLEAVGSSRRVPAATVPGLNWPANPMPPIAEQRLDQAPTVFAPYQRPSATISADAGNAIVYAWIALAASFVCCPIIPPIIGMHYGKQAHEMGHPQGKLARTINMIVLVLQCVGVVVYIGIVAAAIATGGINTAPTRMR